MSRLVGVMKALAKMPILIGAVAAIIMANMFASNYDAVMHVGFTVAGHTIDAHFVAHAAIALFFLYAAAEIREALLPKGALRGVRKAAMPILATIGGVAGPAALYLLLSNHFNQSLARGWVVPTATDIAFAVTVAGLVYGTTKHPAVTVLITLAVLDDTIGIIAIPTVYSDGVNVYMLAIVLAWAIFVPLVLRKFGARSYMWYVLIAGVPTWLAFHFVLHMEAALALVPIVVFMPHKHSDDGLMQATTERVEGELANIASTHDTAHPEHHTKPAHNDTLGRMAWDIDKYVVWPTMLLFGFTSAGVSLGSINDGTGIVLASLLFGKILGIFGAVCVGRAIGLRLPEGVRLKDVPVLGAAAAIGFTVSLFVAGVAFAPGEIQDGVKMGALLSLPAGFMTAMLFAKLLKVGRFAKS